ncbi:hypothetical protein LC607_33865 [Nostoc sp. CHAB 5824]|nr:hypothetical protein [Nostoc sp. CHAB 5824]
MNKIFLKIVALATAGIAVSGCTYDMGLGYASDGYYGDGYYGDGYYNDDYNCDPYGGYDSYYQCDYGQGFYNIGFGGGWYDNYWYPGYGFYLFDNVGRRYTMRDNHRRYWGEKRHRWYRENRGRNRDGDGYRGRGYSDSSTPGTIGWPERNGGRVREDDSRRVRGEGRRGRNDQWRGGDGNGAAAVPVPNPDIVQRPGRGDGYGRAKRRNNDGAGAARVQRQGQPGMRQDGRGERVRGNDEGRSYRQPQAAPSGGQNAPPVVRPVEQPRPEMVRQSAPRQRTIEGAIEQPQ